MEGFVKDYNEIRIREIEQNVYNIGKATVLLEQTKALIENKKLTLDEACDALGISVQEYKDAEDILS